MHYSNSTSINTVSFTVGSSIELYFPDEKVEYRFTIHSRKFNEFNDDFLIIKLPQELKNTFYKGEDFLQCRYVEKNFVYEFGGEIIKLVLDNDPCIIIRKPNIINREGARSKARVSTNILCEYSILTLVPGVRVSRNQGFGTIKDASIDGISFLTTDLIPVNTKIKLDLVKERISFIVEIKKHQMVNNKHFYGARVIEFLNDKTLFENCFNAQKTTSAITGYEDFLI